MRSFCRNFAHGARCLILMWIGGCALSSSPLRAQEAPWWAWGEGQAYAQLDASTVVSAGAEPFTLYISAGPEGIDTTSLPGTGSEFGPPRVLNWSEAQTINSLEDFVLTWSAWEAGLNADFIQFSVADGERVVFESPALGLPGALRGTATTVTIPAGTLRPGTAYVTRMFCLHFETARAAGEVVGKFAELEFNLHTAAPGGIIEFADSQLRVNEAEGTATLHVIRRGEALAQATVEVSAAGGDALPGADFTPASTTLVFDPGVTDVTWTVALENNADFELPEEALFVLGNPSGGAAIGPTSVMSLWITDDDACRYALEPSQRALGPGDDVDSFSVVAAPGCPWTATANRDWIVVLSGNEGEGPGTVVFGVNPNPGTQARSGRITVGGKSFSIRQSAQETNAPAVTITWPPPGFRTTNEGVWLRGISRDDFAVVETQWRLENDAGNTEFQSLPAGTQMVVRVEGLAPGTNTLCVRVRDAAGNWSPVALRQLTHVVDAPLTVLISGEGTVPSPSLDLSQLELGRNYTVTAKPGTGYIFSNWTGSVVGSRARLTFTMESNLTLQANFVPNPFLTRQGRYAGLIYRPDGMRPEGSGGFTFTLGAHGTYSAVVRFAGERYTAAGSFDLNGHAAQQIERPDANPLQVDWQIDFTSDSGQVTGQVMDNDQVSLLQGDQSVFDADRAPAPYQGRYTLRLPGGTDSAIAPGGDGYATVQVTRGGRIELNGLLPDGVPLAQSVPVSRDGHWPVYVPLYKGAGCLLGWLNFASVETNDVSGQLTWSRPGNPNRRRYPEGFTNDLFASGVRYVRPTNAPPLGFLRASVVLSGGSLLEPFPSKIRLLSPKDVLNVDTHPATLGFNPETGWFTGSVLPPGYLQPFHFSGVVFQGWNFGTGLFFETNQIGRVTLQQRQ